MSDSESDPERASPDSKCTICLGRLQSKSFSDSCLHNFCFQCLVRWSKIKPECPLCKQPFKSIIHNVRSSVDYDQYHVPRREPSMEPSIVMSDIRSYEVMVQVLSNEIGSFTRLPMQRRDTLTDLPLYHNSNIRWPSEGRNSNLDSALEDHVITPAVHHPRHYASASFTMQPSSLTDHIITPSAPRRRQHMSLEWPPTGRNSIHINVRRARTRALSFRAAVYSGNRWILPLRQTGRPSNPQYYRANPSQLDRIRPWLERELFVFVRGYLRYSLCEHILTALTNFTMESQEFRQMLFPVLAECTDHFIHELRAFAVSYYDMAGFDENAEYGAPRSSYTNDSDIEVVAEYMPLPTATSPIIISDDDSDPEVVLLDTPSRAPLAEISLSDDDSEDASIIWEVSGPAVKKSSSVGNCARNERTPRGSDSDTSVAGPSSSRRQMMKRRKRRSSSSSSSDSSRNGRRIYPSKGRKRKGYSDKRRKVNKRRDLSSSSSSDGAWVPPRGVDLKRRQWTRNRINARNYRSRSYRRSSLGGSREIRRRKECLLSKSLSKRLSRRASKSLEGLLPGTEGVPSISSAVGRSQYRQIKMECDNVGNSASNQPTCPDRLSVSPNVKTIDRTSSVVANPAHYLEASSSSNSIHRTPERSRLNSLSKS